MNALESRIKGLEEHIEKLYKTIEGWEKLAKEKDDIIKKYQTQIKNNVGLDDVSQQRELLIAYENKVGHMDKDEAIKFVDEYLSDKGN